MREHSSANTVAGFEHDDRKTGTPEFTCRGKSRGAGAHYNHVGGGPHIVTLGHRCESENCITSQSIWRFLSGQLQTRASGIVARFRLAPAVWMKGGPSRSRSGRAAISQAALFAE